MPLLSFKDALNHALIEKMNEDEDIILIGEDIGKYGGLYGVTEGLLDQFGENRVLNTPNSKSTLVGSAVGVALTGMTPVIELSSSDYLPLVLDNLINQAAKTSYLTGGKTSIPLVLRVPSGIEQSSGATQSQNLENLLISIPGIKVVAPTTAQQAKDLLKKSIEDPNPVVFIENRNLYDEEGLVGDEEIYEIGKSAIEKEGTDLTIVSWGESLNKVKGLVDILEKEGISPEIINPLTLHPIDIKPIIDSVIKTSRLVIVHDGPKTGGIGSEIAAQIIESDAFNYLDSPIIRVANKDVPVPFNQNLKKQVEVDDKEILNAIYTVVGMN